MGGALRSAADRLTLGLPEGRNLGLPGSRFPTSDFGCHAARGLDDISWWGRPAPKPFSYAPAACDPCAPVL